jgi:hypothetical protein
MSYAAVNLRTEPRLHNLPKFEAGIAVALVVAKLVIHLATNWRYGYFRDELYYLDCGRHLAFGYADMAPLTPLFAWLGLTLGGSLTAIRLSADIAGACAVLLTVLIARELGGGKFAQFFAGLCTLVAPAMLVMDNFLSTNMWEPALWMGCIWMLIRISRNVAQGRTGESRLWLWFGVFGGLAIENKHSALFFLIALFVAVLLTDLRRELASKWLWYGVGVIFLLSLPNLIWQVQHHFATYELLRNVQKVHKNVVLGPGEYFARQVLAFNPLLLIVWGAGLVVCFMRRQWRVLGWTYVVLFAIMVALKGKDYYFFPIHPMLIAAGAVAWEQWSAVRRWLRPVLTAAALITSAILAPIFVPILSPEKLVAYTRAIHFQPPKSELSHESPLPQYFSDQFGWEELTAEVARDYASLPADERAHTAIFANNYGEAGAINEFGGRFGLPHAISAHQNHYFWGPPVAPVGAKGSNLIVLQDSVEGLSHWCENVSILSQHSDPWGMAEENGPILYCKSLKYNLQDVWPQLKHWN